MAHQAPTSSPSSANGKDHDGNDNNRPLVPTSNLNFVMTKLCYMTGVSADAEDICSESFVESLLEYVHHELSLLESIRNPRRPFRSGTQSVGDRETQPPSHNHSNENDKSSASSEIPSNQSNELVRDSASSNVNTVPVTSLENSKGPTSSCPSPEVIIQPTPDLGQLLNFNETAAGTCAVVEDNFVNELIQPPPPPPLSRPSPRKLKARLSNKTSKNKTGIRRAGKENINNKRTSKPVLKNKCHARGDGLHCTCGLHFKRKSALIQHIRRLTAEKKFKCKQCKKTFYHFCKLKYHLEEQHEIQNPLKKYETGCSLCGRMISTRAELALHQKREHNIHVVRVAISSQISGCMTPRRPGLSPRRPWMSPRPPGMSPRRPWMSPRPPGMSPRRPWMSPRPPWMSPRPPWMSPRPPVMSPRRPWMSPRPPGMSPRRPWMSPRQPGMSPRRPWMSPRQSGLASPNSQKNIRCKKCDEQFQSCAQLNLHIGTNRGKANAIQCNSCKKKFIYKCAFKRHQKFQCCSQLNATSCPSECKEAGGAPEMDLQGGPLISPRNSNLTPPHLVDLDMQSREEVTDNMLVEAPPPNNQATNHDETTSLSPKMDHLQHSNGIMNGKQSESGNSSAEPSVGLNRCNVQPNIGGNYGCVICSRVFKTLQQLRRHQVDERHQSNQQDVSVRCVICKKVFGGCKSFHTHMYQYYHLNTNPEQEKQIERSSPKSFRQQDDSTLYPQMDKQGDNEISTPEDLEMEPYDVNLNKQSQEKETDITSIQPSPPNSKHNSQGSNHNDDSDLISDDDDEDGEIDSLVRENGNSPAPPQVYLQQHNNGKTTGNHSERATSSVKTLPRSSTQNGVSPLPPRMNEHGSHEGNRMDDSRAKAFFEKSSMSVFRSSGSYFCITCSRVIYHCKPKPLIEHLSLVHEKARKVKCDRCKRFFDICKMHHWKQCKNKTAVSYTVSTIRSNSETAIGIPKTTPPPPLPRKERKKEHEKGFKKIEGTAGTRDNSSNRSKEHAAFVPCSSPSQGKEISPSHQEESKREKKRKRKKRKKERREEKRRK